MRRMIIAIAMLLIAPAFAETYTINIPGRLTDKQQAEIQAAASKTYAEAAAVQTPPAVEKPKTVDSVREWTKIGSEVGMGLAASAKELGIAANDFARSPVGKWTMFIIIWRYIGHAIISDIFGFLWLLTILPLWLYVYRRTLFTKVVSTFDKGTGPNGAKRVVTLKPFEFKDHDEKMFWAFLLWIIFFFITIVGISAICGG